MTSLDPDAVEVLLCDADGNLFPSEDPAFDASVIVTNAMLEELGVDRPYTAEELRLATTGKNFRSTAVHLAAVHGASLDTDTLERWVAEEKRAVTAHLGATLRPDPAVAEPLERLAGRYTLAVVSSSATSRLEACFDASGLAPLFPTESRFSAEDSLPVPASKPDPAIYAFAGERLGVSGTRAVAIEDAVPGAQSAVAAGFPTIGNVAFVADGEREERIELLEAAGVEAVVASWAEVEALLGAGARAASRG